MPRLRLLLGLSCVLPLLALAASDAGTPDSYCGGDCNTGVNTQPKHGCNYPFMGDQVRRGRGQGRREATTIYRFL